MSYIPLFLRKLVIRRAKNRCEYCQLSQKGQEATFHVDHIVPIASGGETDFGKSGVGLRFLFAS